MPASSSSFMPPAGLFAALSTLVRRDGGLHSSIVGMVPSGEGTELPLWRLLFRGPVADAGFVRLGLFGAVHGDEPAGALAILELLEAACQQPDLFRGVELICYPLCNPTGFMRGTRANRAGVDLNREFWRGSDQAEVQFLESELRLQQFDGLVALHADCDSAGMYAFARGPVTSEELVGPALAAAEGVLPRNTDVVIDGFSARDGVIRECYPGVLAPPPEQTPAPFEIILETPGKAPCADQVRAAVSGLRGLIAALPRLSIGGAGI